MSKESEELYNSGFIEGWMAASLDYRLIHQYHTEADALTDDTDAVALAKIWADCVFSGNEQEAQWNKLSTEQKLARGERIRVPFWKSGKGQPRRLSHG